MFFVVFTPSHHGSVLALTVISLLLTNTVSSVPNPISSVLERLTHMLIPSSFALDTVESEGQQTKQSPIKYFSKNRINKLITILTCGSIHAF